MKRSAIAALAFVTCPALANDQPPVRFVVEMREGGKIVECPSATGVLGQLVKVPLSGGAACRNYYRQAYGWRRTIPYYSSLRNARVEARRARGRVRDDQ